MIDAVDRVLMPGMSDAHVHLIGMANIVVDIMTAIQTQLADVCTPAYYVACIRPA